MTGRVSSFRPAPAGSMTIVAKTVKEELSFPILLAERIKKAAEDAISFIPECDELGKLADSLAHKLRMLAKIATANQSLYDRPLRRVVAECSKSLERALNLSRPCRRGVGFFQRIVTTIVGSSDFRKAAALLETSVADMKWLISVYSSSLGTSGGDGGGDIEFGLPPVASNDPILSLVWGYIAVIVHSGAATSGRVAAADALTSLADDNRSKKIIMVEGGVPPLLSLLKDTTSIDGQLAAVAALTNIASCRAGASVIVSELGVPTIIEVLSQSPMKLQVRVALLVSELAAQDSSAQEEFARENANRPLVTLLSYELPTDNPKATSIHSLIQINHESHNVELRACDGSHGGSRDSPSWSLDSRGWNARERERESPEVKFQLKVACAKALWVLSRGNASICRKISVTRGMLCLAMTIEMEKGELQHNCLMTLMEICAVAEVDADLRCSAFKRNSSAAKLAVGQLVRMVQEIKIPMLQLAAIKSIGCLSHTFTAKETRAIQALVAQLNHWNPEIAAEAAVALGKFVDPGNFLCIEHSKTIIKSGGLPMLMILVRSANERARLNALILICYLSLHESDNEALDRAKVVTTLESGLHVALVVQHPLLGELLPKAIHHLELYHTGRYHQRQPYAT